MRLIDLDVLREQIVEVRKYAGFYSPIYNGFLNIIDRSPIIDAEPVKHGEWISLTECANAGVYCSVCSKKVYKEDYAWCNKKNKVRSNYCPNCGAKMDLNSRID